MKKTEIEKTKRIEKYFLCSIKVQNRLNFFLTQKYSKFIIIDLYSIIRMVIKTFLSIEYIDFNTEETLINIIKKSQCLSQKLRKFYDVINKLEEDANSIRRGYFIYYCSYIMKMKIDQCNSIKLEIDELVIDVGYEEYYRNNC